VPGGWTGTALNSPYKYWSNANGTFHVCASGDGTAADSNGGTSCP
jgi:hypothetical protein